MARELKTHCLRGHEFTDDNTLVRQRDRGRGTEISRTCRTCHYAANKRHVESDKYNREQRNLYARKWRVENADRVRNGRLKAGYGITLSTYNEMANAQNLLCLICGQVKKLVVDHNHTTGAVRGLLCSSCNMRLGWLENNYDAVVQYLDKYKGENHE